VKQILVNLVQNALEANPRGAAVEIETAAAERDAVLVRVLDRGPGPARELGEQVFDPGVTTKSRGSGLGLTISRALARQHGGELTLAARAGGGCAAELRLPAGSAGPANGAAA
jgi:signal transduction histidine kinase